MNGIRWSSLWVAGVPGLDPDVLLTARERGLLLLGADGLPDAEIATRPHLAEGTVRDHLSTAITRLGARDRTEAAKVARERGWS